MTEQAPALTRHDLEAKIVKRCWEDEGFRKEFTADPAGAFVKYLQVPTESLAKIIIHQEEPGSWHIVLPAKPADAGELSEEELEGVAGGEKTIHYYALAGIVLSGAVVTEVVVSVKTVGW